MQDVRLKLVTLAVASLAFLLVGLPNLKAEPWLGTRFAQNCSGCHAPQRINVLPKDRRCSLSCQGCHVNPNGGGLRSFYGKWNDNRWLSSFRAEALGHEKYVPPVGKQIYGKQPYESRPAAKNEGYVTSGLPLVEADQPSEEAEHGREFGNEKRIAADRDEYLYWVPEKDPWREMGRTKFNAGADARWLMAASEGTTKGSAYKNLNSFLMSADFGLEYRPIYRHLHLVNETRIYGTPNRAVQREQVLTSQVKTRNLYVLVDDLPWNTFVMAGYYRPLFGNQVPDHEALAQRMQAFLLSDAMRAQDLSFNAVTVGTAPNVPYFNLHLIQGRLGESSDKTRGIGSNAGLRFVTLGLSLNYSFWQTYDDRGEQGKIDTTMHSLGFALMFARTVFSYEAISFYRDNKLRDLRQGGVHSIDTMTRLWRENYLLLNLASANTSADVSTGAAEQYQTGLRSFLVPGLDLSLIYGYEFDKNEVAKNKSARRSLNGQVHTYF